MANLKGERGEQGPQGIQGEKGEKGDNGTSFRIVGTVNTAAELPPVATTELGTAYFVGATSPREVYSLVENQSGERIWQNEGTLQGPQGPPGESKATSEVTWTWPGEITRTIKLQKGYMVHIKFLAYSTSSGRYATITVGDAVPTRLTRDGLYEVYYKLYDAYQETYLAYVNTINGNSISPSNNANRVGDASLNEIDIVIEAQYSTQLNNMMIEVVPLQ